MIILITIVTYLVANLYIINRLSLWFKDINRKYLKLILLCIYITLSMMPILGYILPISNIQEATQKIANNFTPVLLHTFLVLLTSNILAIILYKILKITRTKKQKKINIIIQITIICIVSLYGFYHAKDIQIKRYDINIEKKAEIKSLKVALISDIHLGYNIGFKTVQKVKEKINSEDIDLILIAGDIFDNSYDAVDDIDKVIKNFKSIKSTYGTFAVFGNHDVDEKLFAGMTTTDDKKANRDRRMEKLLEKSNIEILDDESRLIDYAFYLIGRKDYKKAGNGTNNRKKLEDLLEGIDKNKPIILLEHEPINIDKISKSGVDLHLSGHTHGGQFFPMTLITRNKWENQYGYIKENKMHSIVTSGIGLYGPNIRTASDSEICILNIKFK